MRKAVITSIHYLEADRVDYDWEPLYDKKITEWRTSIQSKRALDKDE
jgi:hypothetical protein